MATTTLHPTGLPGKPYSFSPKSAASGEHTGDFTRLSVLGVPGSKHSFVAKSPADEGVHTGDFTRLSVLGVPGGIHSFLAKQEAEVIEAVGEGALDYMKALGKLELETEEEELLFIIYAAHEMGYLH